MAQHIEADFEFGDSYAQPLVSSPAKHLFCGTDRAVAPLDPLFLNSQDSISMSQCALLSEKASNILISAGRRKVIFRSNQRSPPQKLWGGRKEGRKESTLYLKIKLEKVIDGNKLRREKLSLPTKTRLNVWLWYQWLKYLKGNDVNTLD